jgi:pimeloyl-ACP methyl ester carboxylesterase
LTRTRTRGLLLAGALALLGAAAPAQADAAVRFKRCAQTPLPCAKVKVPLDHSGGARGSLKLHVERAPGAGRKPRGVFVALAGGPGQSATVAFQEGFLPQIAPALRGRDAILFDQRGTGRSGALRCPAFERAIRRRALEREAAEAEACARRIGSRRRFFTTRDSVEDLEAVRRALGVRRIALYGVSYGTKVALAYAQRYPNRVERLVLDSVQELDGPDPLYRDTFAAMPRALAAVCAGGACDGVTSDPAADLAALVEQIGDGELSGPVIDHRGVARTRSVDRLELFFLMLAGDFDSSLRAAVPSVVGSALRGDPAPLLRLTMPAVLLPEGLQREAPAFTEAVFAATICEEALLPWERTAPVEERLAQASATVGGLPESAFYPFNRASVLETEFMRICSRWPTHPEPPLLRGSPPDVPTLMLGGEDDLRTPLEEARRVAATLPDAALIEVAATGHGVLADPPPCVKRALRLFFAGRTVRSARCERARDARPEPLAPLSLDEVAPAPGTDGKVGRTAGAAGLTVRDISAQTLYAEGGGGLRSGRWRVAKGLRLSRVVFVPGVEVSGTLDFRGVTDLVGTLSVGGEAGAHGTLRFRRGGRVTGTLDGQAVDTRVNLGDMPDEEEPVVPPPPA